MLARLRTLGDPDLGRELRGTNVYDVDGEKLGTVDDVLVDTDSSDVRYLVVDAGWLTTQRFVVPADQAFAQPGGDGLVANLSKADVKRLPDFNEETVDAPGAFERYEQSYRSAYTFPPAGGPEHPHLARLREHLGSRRFAERAPRADRVAAVEQIPPAGERVVRSEVDRPTGVYGLYSDRDSLERAVGRLKDLGFSSNDISVVFPDEKRSHKFAVEQNTKAPEGALAGGGTGLVVGGVLGWLAGIGVLALPGIGPIIAAGPIVAAITGAGVGSAIGGIAGALIGLGMPELEAKRYEAEVKKGGMLLSVNCADIRFAESARKILRETGARDLFWSGEQRAA